MRGLNGDKWSWDWKRFKAAINNMGWDVDTQKTKEVKVKVEKKSTGWWVVGKGGEQSVIPVVKDKDKGKEAKRTAAAPAPKATASPIVTKAVPEAKPKPRREGSTSSIMSTISLPFSRPAPPPPPPPPSSALTTLTAQIPLWLLAATEAIAAVGNEHSDALTTIAAILISLGGLHAGGSPALCMATEVAGAIGRTLKAASNGEGHRH
ncbi:hypothetical protein A0H81_05167 [Grifola frondosa]|uniref:Uncharacterized protein n=1 Tax=Grifola frondosa TaxID=5627 RepID=A0A1C7MDA4_GRIFR|nr:hypothetical protein A0H81_05167 [Grifola frondosa]